MATGNGSVSPASGTTYNYDTALGISATADPGWAFTGWTGDTGNLTNPAAATTTIKADTFSNTTVSANFEKINYTLTIDVATGNGSVSPASGTTYNYDTALGISATATAGWEFVNWTGPGVVNLADANAATTTILNPVYGDTEVHANFQRKTYSLTLSKIGVDPVTAGTGSISLAGGGSAPDSGAITLNYLFEDVVDLTATPSGGSIFRRWEGDPAGNPASTTIIIDAARTATAVFGHKVSASLNDPAMGTVLPAGVQEYDFGATPTYGISPAADHCIVDVQVDGVGSIPEPQTDYIFPPLNANRTLTATFRPAYTVKVTFDSAGAISYGARFQVVSTSPAWNSGPQSSGTLVKIPCGIDMVEVQFVDTPCWEPPTSETVTFSAGNENWERVISYTAKPMTLLMEKDGVDEDSVSPDVGPHTYDCGTEVDLIATPAEGSEFVGWTGNGVVDPTLPKTKIVVTESRTVKATFTRDIWTLSMAFSGQGTVTPAVGNHGYEEGQTVTIEAVPNTADGWVFSRWDGLAGTLGASGTPVDIRAATVTFNIYSDKDLMAVFTQAAEPDVDNDGDGYTENGGDCNDFDASIHPDATEVCGDGIDQDCDGLDLPCDTVNIDNDFDGFTVNGAGVAPYFLTGVDCDDNDPAVYPGANEVCGDNIDQNCDGSDLACAGGDIDADGDGYTANMGDCDDANSGIYPGAYDDPFNSVNEDCYDGVRPVADELACVEIADIPLETQVKAANANIMILLDDSGSMDWEYITTEYDGLFDGEYYVFDNPGDNAYTSSTYDQYNFSDAERVYWKSQWSEYNTMFYNPASTYVPWPGVHAILGYGDAEGNAPLTTPRSNPALGTTFNLEAEPYLVLKGGGIRVTLTRENIGDSTCADAVRFVKVVGGQTVIVDNESPSGFETSGSWPVSSGYYGYYPAISSFSSSANHSQYTNTAGAVATWKPILPATGEYRVYASWTKSGTRPYNAPYRIYNNSGALLGTVRVNQNDSSLDGQWNLLGTYTFNDVASAGDREIHRAHYYLQKNGSTYLVELDGGIHIFPFSDDNGNDRLDYGEIAPRGAHLSQADALALGVWPLNADGTLRTYQEERQNFVNWYSYYRRRILTAKAAVSQVIANMHDVNIGLHTIHERIAQAVIPVDKSDDLSDTTQGKGRLLNMLYNAGSTNPRYIASGGTPLRLGLKRVGQYFDATDTATGGIGASPYVNFDDGGACQQSFAIVMTDGYWNGATPSVGNNDSDGFSNTLADVAALYYNKDLSSLADLVPTHGLDQNRQQHMVSFGVSFGVVGTLPADYCSTSQPEDCVWDKDPAVNDRYKIDDLLHASRNGRGDFLSAGNPELLVEALNAIKQKIEARIGTGASVAISSQELQTGTVLFQGLYDANNWTGDIKAFELVSQEEAEADPSLTVGTLKPSPKWSAETKLNNRNWDTRQIITWNGANGVPFRKDALSLDTALLPHLNSNADTAGKMVDYLRGATLNEQPDGLGFRSRGGKLGDIVHSAPLKNGDTLYVGANDGMLHAFDVATGEEVFAYVPRLVFQNLKKLAVPNPNYAHTYFVDNSPYAGKVGDRTYLVGGLGKGGKGYFCLDITATANAETNANGIVKWEYPNPTGTPDPDNVYDPSDPVFADPDWADLGYSFSRAFIFNSNAGGPFVIFGNGYDSYNKKAVLFILNAHTGQVLAKIDTGAGGWGPDGIKDTADDQCNGLSTPVLIDHNLDGKVDYAYAGDLLGNLWKFDLTANSANLWKVAYGTAGDPQPLFVAKNREGHRQPITTQPDVMSHCRFNRLGYLVIFGTGRYLGDEDFTDNSVQSLYGIWDWALAWEASGVDSAGKYFGEFTPGRQLSNLAALGINATLLEQTQIYYGSFFGENYGILSDNDISWYMPSSDTGNHVGWFFDLPATGERTVRDVIIRDNIAIVVSSIPSSSPCSSGGYSYLTEINACSGGRTISAQFDANNDGVIDSRDLVDIGSSAKSQKSSLSRKEVQGMPHAPAVAEIPGTDIEVKYFSNSDGSVIPIKEKKIQLGMSSWRELEGK